MDTNQIYNNYQYSPSQGINNQTQKVIPVNIANGLKRKYNHIPLKSNTSYLSNAKKKNLILTKSPSSNARNKISNNISNSKMITEDSRYDIYSVRAGNNSQSYIPKTPVNPNQNMSNYSECKKRPTSVTKIRSPSKNCSSRCHKYHSDLDYNYLSENKFFNDSNNAFNKNSSLDKFNKKTGTSNLPKGRGNDSYINIYSSDTLYSNETNITNKGKLRDNKMVNSYSKEKKQKSEGVLGDLLDSHFSINSPSRRKIFQSEMDQIKSEEFRQKKQNKDNHKDKIYYDEDPNAKVTINLSFVGESPQEKLVEALENIMVLLDPIFDRLTLGEKIEKFLENTNDTRRVIK